MIYSIVLVLMYRKVIQLHIYKNIFQIIFHYSLVQDVEYSSLCYEINPHCLSILYIVVCIPNLSLSSLSTFGNHKLVFYVCECVFVLNTGSFVLLNF